MLEVKRGFRRYLRSKPDSLMLVGFWLLWFACCQLIFAVGFAGWPETNITIAADVAIFMAALPVAQRLRFEPSSAWMLPQYRASIAAGRFCAVYCGWFCANVLGNIVAITGVDPNLDQYVSQQQSSPFEFLLLSLVVAPIAEEVLFRGVIYQYIRSGFGIWLAAILSSVIFGISHGTVAHFVVALIFGILQCFLLEYTRSLLWVIAAHMCINLSSSMLGRTGIRLDGFLNLPMILLMALLAMFCIWSARIRE